MLTITSIVTLMAIGGSPPDLPPALEHFAAQWEAPSECSDWQEGLSPEWNDNPALRTCDHELAARLYRQGGGYVLEVTQGFGAMTPRRLPPTSCQDALEEVRRKLRNTCRTPTLVERGRAKLIIDTGLAMGLDLLVDPAGSRPVGVVQVGAGWTDTRRGLGFEISAGANTPQRSVPMNGADLPATFTVVHFGSRVCVQTRTAARRNSRLDTEQVLVDIPICASASGGPLFVDAERRVSHPWFAVGGSLGLLLRVSAWVHLRLMVDGSVPLASRPIRAYPEGPRYRPVGGVRALAGVEVPLSRRSRRSP